MSKRVPNEELDRQALKEEIRLLSILLKDKDCLMDAVSLPLKEGASGHFWISENNILWGIMKEYYLEFNELLTRTAIDSVMDTRSKLGSVTLDDDDRTTVRMYWDKVYNSNAPIEDYGLLKKNINNRFLQAQTVAICKEGLEELVKATGDQEKIVSDIREKFLTIENIDIDSYCLTMSIEEGVEKAMEHIEKRREYPLETEAIMTGIVGIDNNYHGFPRGSYNIVSGMINGGKTTIMFNIAFNMARAGYNVVFVSIEKEAIPFFTRLLSLHALTDYNRIKVGGKGDKGLNDYHFQKLKEAANDLRENIKPNLDCIQMPQGVKLSKILAEIDKIKARKNVDVIFVDYLGVVGFETHHPGRPDLDEARISQRLQAYGKVNRFVTFTASQLKTPSVKEIRNKAKKATADDPSSIEINTEDFAGSKMIIADADNAFGVVLNGDSPATKMYVYGTKARDDEARRRIVLDFDGAIGRVSDPVFEPGQIIEVDRLIYDSSITEAILMSDDGLFTDEMGGSPQLNDDDFDALGLEPSKSKSEVVSSDIEEINESLKTSGHTPHNYNEPEDDLDDILGL